MSRRVYRSAWATTATIIVLASCGNDDQPEQKATAVASSLVEAVFLDAENRVLRSPATQIDFEVRAEGAVTASIRGVLYLEGRDRGHLDATGTFDSMPVQLNLVSDGERMVGGSSDQVFDVEAPPRLREAFVVGLTRMGIMHNLARLTGGQPPDHTDGTVRDWLTLDDWKSEPEAAATTFQLSVDGEPSAVATVWIDGSGLPARREQTVRFDNGEMRVMEQYRITELEAGVNPERFRVGEQNRLENQ